MRSTPAGNGPLSRSSDEWLHLPVDVATTMVRGAPERGRLMPQRSWDDGVKPQEMCTLGLLPLDEQNNGIIDFADLGPAGMNPMDPVSRGVKHGTQKSAPLREGDI